MSVYAEGEREREKEREQSNCEERTLRSGGKEEKCVERKSEQAKRKLCGT